MTAEFPLGNDVIDRSGCPRGTGTAPGPCTGPGNAGCPKLTPKVKGEEGVGSFFEGAVSGGFSDNDSWSAIAGSTVIGFIPVVGQIADIRDLAAATVHVAEGREGAWLELGASALGVIPGLDGLKAGAKAVTKAGREALEEVVERGAKEVADHAPIPTRAVSAARGGGTLPRFQGPKPTYHVNEAHVPGSSRFNPKKEPLPADAAEVFKKAVPDAAEGANNWYGKNADGTIYRFSNANDGTAHFSGSSASKDGIRNITPYARQRLEGK